MTSSQTTEESGQEGENPPNDSLPKRTDYLPEKRDELATVVQQLEEVIRIKELCIDRLTKELNDARDQSALLEGQSAKSLDLKEDRIEELEEALRESVRITADREVALDAETQHRTILDQKVSIVSLIDTESYQHFFFLLIKDNVLLLCPGWAAGATITVYA